MTQASPPAVGGPGAAQIPGAIGFDTRTPNAARIYNYLLGGKDNFEADREIAERLLQISRGDARVAALDNRKFLRNAMEFLAGEAGITQFLDIGSGLPSMGNVHEVVGEHNQGARVVYADYDKVVVSHAQNRLTSHHPRVTAVLGDLRDPEGITGHHVVRELIDFAQPVAVSLVAVLHFLDDRDASGAVDHLKDLLAPGSYLVVSHATADGARDGEADKITGLYEGASAPLHLRPQEEIGEYFRDLELVPPGVVEAGNWRSKTLARRVVCWAAIGRKRWR